jgi:hypothetical protein
MEASSPAAGVLSLQLGQLTGLPHRPSGSVVQLVATLLQGSRREQRTSVPLPYADSVTWPQDEVSAPSRRGPGSCLPARCLQRARSVRASSSCATRLGAPL